MFPRFPLAPLVQLLAVPTWSTLGLSSLSHRSHSPPRPDVAALMLLNGQIWRETGIQLRIGAVNGGEKHEIEKQEEYVPEAGAGVTLEVRFEVARIE